MLILENGTKVSAEGLSYAGPSLVWENGATLLDARLETFTTKGETTRSLLRAKAYPNHCHVNFPSATHRIRMLWDGGVSLDGANPITPDRVDLFNIRDDQGVLLPNESILGLADLGSESIPSSAADRSAYAVDMVRARARSLSRFVYRKIDGHLLHLRTSLPIAQTPRQDHYLDICLHLGDESPRPASVDVICGDDTQISMPKGLKASAIYAPRTPPRCAPHTVVVSK